MDPLGATPTGVRRVSPTSPSPSSNSTEALATFNCACRGAASRDASMSAANARAAHGITGCSIEDSSGLRWGAWNTRSNPTTPVPKSARSLHPRLSSPRCRRDETHDSLAALTVHQPTSPGTSCPMISPTRPRASRCTREAASGGWLVALTGGPSSRVAPVV